MPTNPYVIANDFAGADLGDKINTALAGAIGLNGGPGEVLVVYAAGLSIDTAVVIGAYQCVRFQPGTYGQTKPITLVGIGAQLVGAGEYSTTLANTSSSEKSVVLLPNGDGNKDGMEVSRLYLRRSAAGALSSTAVGVDASLAGSSTTVERSRIRDLVIDGHYVGIALGQTNYSRMDRCLVENSYSNNVQIKNAVTIASGVLQWNLSDMVFQNSQTGAGLSLASQYPNAGATMVTLGTWTNINTFHNATNGIWVQAATSPTAIPIHGVRMLGGFIGSDLADAIYLDSYGLGHRFCDLSVELAGANGFAITRNNLGVSITGCSVYGCTTNGILTSALNTIVVGCEVINNGTSHTQGADTGIYVIDSSANAVVGGNRSGNTPVVVGGSPPMYQAFGVYTVPTNVTVTGNRCNDNTDPNSQIGGSPAQNTGNLTM